MSSQVQVELNIPDSGESIEPRSLQGTERLGEASCFNIDAFSPTPIDPSGMVGLDAVLVIRNSQSRRTIRGVITRFTSLATTNVAVGRNYRVELRSTLRLCELRRRTRVFQHMRVPDVIRQLAEEIGYSSGNIALELTEDHPEREYLVQYAETDATFIRRLCEEEGLFFYFAAGDSGEQLIVADNSTLAEDVLGEPLRLNDRGLGEIGTPRAYDWHSSQQLNVGKVTLRDYNPQTPAMTLEAMDEDGLPLEKDIEVYEAPGRFNQQTQGSLRATRRLQSLRARSSRCGFTTTALTLAPGAAVVVEPDPDLNATQAPNDAFFVVAAHHQYADGGYQYDVEAIPLSLPFRLSRTTERPIVHGLHHAFITTADGEEINVDDAGRVRLHFPWDREGPRDDQSSLPVRVAQPNTPGSMLLPRGGWEVMVAFEDGDPDRPYVVGRVFNAKAPPPYSLPINKTMTSVGTVSSPGGGKENRININDAAGSQNLAFLAGFNKAANVANNMLTQTGNNENITVTSSQVSVVGANEAVSVTEAYLNNLGSQSATVGGMQKVFVKGDFSVGVGPESVVVGAACLEKVGNPVAGAKNLAKSAALQGAAAMGVPVQRIMAGAAVAQAAVKGYQQGGVRGALGAAGGAAAGQAVNAVAGMIPGGNLMAGVAGAGSLAPWVEEQINPGAAASGGGAAGGGNAAAAKGPGPGHRNTIVEGAYTELIGAACSATSPGSIGWTTIGASTHVIGGAHNITARNHSIQTLGASTEVLGSLGIKAASNVSRDIKGLLSTTISGSLTSKAGGQHSIKAGASLSLKVGGALTMDGGTIAFICGGSKLVASPGGVILSSSSITITNNTTQAGINHK